MPWWRSRAARAVGTALALALLLAAVLTAVSGVDFGALRQASPGLLAAAAVLVVVNLVAAGGLFWAVTRSFDPAPAVGPGRMIELISASALLNYLPGLQPGLWGRAAYLKARHGLPVRHSVAILAVVLATAVAVSGATLALLLPVSTLGRWIALLGLLSLLAGWAGPVARVVLRRPVAAPWLWVPLRTIDLLAAGGRLWVAFAIVGQPIGFEAAVLVAAGSVLAKLVGVTPNGLGLSEWAVAALAGVLSPVSTAAGAGAALVDRAVEVLVVAAAGSVAAWRLRAAGVTRDAAASP